MVQKLFSIFDFLPGLKSNTGLLVFLVTTIAQLAGVSDHTLELIKQVAAALMAYGIAAKAVRPMVQPTK